MSIERSVTRWLRELEAGSEEAANQLWHRYFWRLVALARKRLGSHECRVADEEDVALSVFRCLYDGAARGQFAAAANRDELWRLLVTMTGHKVVDYARHANQQKRGGGRVRGGSALECGDDGVAWDPIDARQPSPELLAILAEEHERLMHLLGEDCLRQIALWRLEGYKNEEIAARLGVTCRSVERKVQRIRRTWSRELSQ
jgi:DNA-directed RNA polymerase specialized sigma24 family protein